MGKGRSLGIFLVLVVLVGCREHAPLVFIEQVGRMPEESFSRDCNLPVLPSRPQRPHEVIARLKSYSDSEERINEMKERIRREACTIGAQAVVFEPLEYGKYRAEGTYEFPKAQGDEYREFTIKVERSLRLVGLAIVYRDAPPPSSSAPRPALASP